MAETQQKVESLSLANIQIDGGTQIREEIDESTVAEYVELAKNGAVFPPITVYHDGKRYWLADGFHRYWSAAKRKAKSIRAHVLQGTKREAILHAVGANAEHGKRRTNEDKRSAVMTLLEDEEWAKWSDNAIAKQARVSDKTVAKLRDQLRNSEVEGGSRSQNGDSGQRKGLDGKKRSAKKKTSKKAKKKAASKKGEGGSESEAVKDGTGQPVEYDHLIPVFRGAAEWRRATNEAGRLLKGIIDECHEDHGAALNSADAHQKKNATLNAIRKAIPHAPHHACRGQGCEGCEGRGWLTKSEHRMEQRDAEAAAK